MAELPAFTPLPSRVHHRARALTGHHPIWICRASHGSIYAIAHFRICSWCGCIHPVDLIDILKQGQSTLEATSKPGKFLFKTPNPIAGDLVRRGSMPGPIFERGNPPADLRHKLSDPVKRGLMFTPTIGERLSGHFERPALEVAPTTIVWPFYAEHTTDRQWPEIWTAASTCASDKPSDFRDC